MKIIFQGTFYSMIKILSKIRSINETTGEKVWNESIAVKYNVNVGKLALVRLHSQTK